MEASAVGRPSDWFRTVVSWADSTFSPPRTRACHHRHCEVGAPPSGDGRRSLGGSRHCLHVLLRHRHAATCGIPAASMTAQGLSGTPAVVTTWCWRALVDGGRAALTPPCVILTPHAETRASVLWPWRISARWTPDTPSTLSHLHGRG
jgi:hypothetical protein